MHRILKQVTWYRVIIGAILLCVQGTLAQQSPSEVLHAIRARQTIVIGMESNSPPMNYVNAQNQRDGFDYKLAQELAKQMGIPNIEVKEADYEVLPELLRTGQIDMIMGGYVPDPSIDGVEWSQGYLQFGLCLIVRTSSAITKVKHLQGKTVAIYNDPAAEEWVLEHIPNVNIQKYSGDSGWFEAVENGEADALIYDYPFAVVEIKNYPRTKIVAFNLNQTHYAIGLPAKNFDLVDAVNDALTKILAADVYRNLVNTYLAYQSDQFTKVEAAAGQSTYTVKSGDTLLKIAQQQLGSSKKWGDIWKLNQDRIPNPDLIRPGYALVMP